MAHKMSHSGAKNSRVQPRTGKLQGWAAFDQKQRQQQQQQQQGHLQPPQVVVRNNNNTNNVDPFPPLLATTTSLSPSVNMNVVLPTATERSFSSVFLPSVQFPPMPHTATAAAVTSSTSDSGLIHIPPDSAFNQLKQLHTSADTSLIRDVLSSVNNDFQKASTLLTDILSTPNYLSDSNDIHSHKAQDDSSFFENTSTLAADLADLSSTLEHALQQNHEQLDDSHSAPVQGLSQAAAAAANMNFILGHLKSIPVQPEWEDHDLYLTHRRNALKMMRLASRHSRMATNAYLRGDHFSAQQESLRARKEWLGAEKLNAEAANEILSIRNSENNPWKLDLHGLHAVEAVQALEEHLKKIETQLSMKQPVSGLRVETMTGGEPSSVEALNSMDVKNLDIPRMGSRQRPGSLQVITGIGKHSRGEAALPASVKSFLNENRYRFEEPRPGVISVFPKFHRG